LSNSSVTLIDGISLAGQVILLILTHFFVLQFVFLSSVIRWI